MQINICANTDVSKEQALDPEFALSFAAKAIKEGKQDKWSVCNCYAFASVLTDITSPVTRNSAPTVGSIAIFDYKGVPHYAVVVELKLDGFMIREANYEPCKTGTRLVKWNDPAIVGFYSPTSALAKLY